ncbi:MAG TPA: Ig-like domain-containing protein [Candidatus Nitrosotalea sp.]|nr:Ig-like domain-containing protein [Candidatus Nitrosotalea sp.]
MRYLIILAFALVLFPSYAFADDASSQLDARLVPSQIMVNTDSIIQVTPKTFGNAIDGLIATSSDSSIVKILGIDNDPAHNAYDIKIRAVNSGQVTINIAASGFSPAELPITISPDTRQASMLLIKATPKAFTNPGPNVGYVSVETTNSDGVPTPVTADTPIKLSTSDSTAVSLASSQVTIPKGSYFVTSQFVVNAPGDVQLYASAPSMAPVSTDVGITNVATPYTLQAYAYPPLVNDIKDSVSYIIVQLHDAAGNPVIAKEDIPVSVHMVNTADTTSINTSYKNPYAQVNDDLLIKKGSYWGYVPVEFTAGNNATYNVEISAKGYVISTIPTSTTITTTVTVSSTGNSGTTGTTTITGTTKSTTTSSSSTSLQASTNTAGGTATSTTQTTATGTGPTVCAANPVSLSSAQVQIATLAQNYVIDDKYPCFYQLPILATGNKELVGVLALEDSSGYPALAKSGLSFRVDSSDTSTVSISGVQMNYGDQSALVFAQVGNTANPVTLNVVSDSPQQITPVITAPSQTASSLVADPLVSTVLPGTNFPLAIYATNNGALAPIKKDFTALISPQESISPIQLTVTNSNPVFLNDETLLKEGSQNIAITTPDYSSSFIVQGQSSKPSSIVLGYPDQIYANAKSLFMLELLDDKQLPILADKDTDIKLVSSNSSILDVPQSVEIKKGTYFTTFDATPKTFGNAEIAVLSDDVPLSKFDITVASFTPTVTVDSVDHVDNNQALTATATVSYNQVNLAGISVSWKVTGATINHMDTVTDSNGKATISMTVTDPNTVNIEADVGGGAFTTVAATKQVAVNPPMLPANGVPTGSQSGMSVFGVNPLLFIIPGAGAAAFFVLKKREMLEGITEKIGMAGKFSEMRERMSGFGEK